MNKFLTRFFIVLIVMLTAFLGMSANGGDSFVFSSDRAEIPQAEVYLGGKPLGVEIGAEGVIVTGTGGVVTDKGLIKPLEGADIQCGDILLTVGGTAVKKPDDITVALSGIKGRSITLTYKRGDNEMSLEVTPVRDALTGEKRIGIFVSEDILGVGTLSYVKMDGRFGALGHHITDPKTGLTGALTTGNIFDCEIVGVTKPDGNRAGGLHGDFSTVAGLVGDIDKNNQFGIFGSYTGDVSQFKIIKTAAQDEIKNGKAHIYTCIEGDVPDYYTVDIVKTYRQDAPETKSMVISVTDKRLIAKTGGIVQGMSGSPIVQNGKLVGAVTHVFVNDATKGYGVYIDWMLQN